MNRDLNAIVSLMTNVLFLGLLKEPLMLQWRERDTMMGRLQLYFTHWDPVKREFTQINRHKDLVDKPALGVWARDREHAERGLVGLQFLLRGYNITDDDIASLFLSLDDFIRR